METRRGGGLKDWREGKCFATQKLSHFELEDWREGRQKVQMLGGLKGGKMLRSLKDWGEGKCLEDWRIGGLKDWREGRQKVQMLGGLED